VHDLGASFGQQAMRVVKLAHHRPRDGREQRAKSRGLGVTAVAGGAPEKARICRPTRAPGPPQAGVYGLGARAARLLAAIAQTVNLNASSIRPVERGATDG